jgi:uncharacterized protein (TIGR02145 family)
MEKININGSTWSKSNLKLSSFQNGDPIVRAYTINEWRQAFKNGIAAFWIPEVETEIHGYLYNYWALIDPRGLYDRTEWMIPRKKDWEDLIAVCGGAEVAGYNMKSKSGWSHHDYKYERSISCRKCKEWNEEYKSKVACHHCHDSRNEIIIHNGNGMDVLGFDAKPSGTVEPDNPDNLAFPDYLATWWIDDWDEFRWDELPVLGSLFTYRPKIVALTMKNLDCQIVQVGHNTGHAIRLFSPFAKE